MPLKEAELFVDSFAGSRTGKIPNADWRILFYLTAFFCNPSKSQLTEAPIRWARRRDAAKLLVEYLATLNELVDSLKTEEAWLQTWEEIFGKARTNVATSPERPIEFIHRLNSLTEAAEHLDPLLRTIEKMRKPHPDDDSNYYLFLAAAYLRGLGRNSEIKIYREIAAYVSAHRYSQHPNAKDSHMEAEAIRTNCIRYQTRNPEIAERIRLDPSSFISETIPSRKIE
jgi:hypothetical protein